LCVKNIIHNFAQKQQVKNMTFDNITGNGRLWAVRFENEKENELYNLFEKWNNVVWLRDFFKSNRSDLVRYFNIVDLNRAISDTISDSEYLEILFLDMSPDIDLDTVFRPLSNYTQEPYLEKEKAKISKRRKHASWLRIYAVKPAHGMFIITGGAIKLTPTMQERSHTAQELVKIEKVRRFLIENGIVDENGFEDYLKEL
jgi:hypothetical protein